MAKESFPGYRQPGAKALSGQTEAVGRDYEREKLTVDLYFPADRFFELRRHGRLIPGFGEKSACRDNLNRRAAGDREER